LSSTNSTSFSLSEVQQWIGGSLANEASLNRSPADVRVTGVFGMENSKPEHLAFFFSKSYQNELLALRAGILITGKAFAGPLEKSGLPLWKSTAVVVCDDPYLAMATISKKFAEHQSTISHIRSDFESKPVIHPTAVVDASVKLGLGVRVGAHAVIDAGTEIGEGTVIYPGCFVGPGCRIGKGCVLFPNVVLYEWTELGDRVRLHAGAVIGADGFGYAPRSENGKLVAHEKIYHLGKVIIADDVEVGAGSTIDRGTVANTRIDRGAKIDNNVQVGHNAHIGEGVVLCGNVGVGGSVTIGKFVYVGGLAGLGNRAVVGDGAKIGSGTLIGKDVQAGESVVGYPHRNAKDFFKIQALLNQLLENRKATKFGKES
jgi:UDP-3-O-[3-hydroxymyristoyl] glucosamine N-acyltransferase